MRLDKYISNSTDYSRKDVRRLLREKLLTLDGVVCKSPSLHITPGQILLLDGHAIQAPGFRYFMLHKPQGYVCATKDSEHPIVIDFLEEPNKDKLQIAGRLDIDTTGLVLITDDGQWNHAITAPNRDCKKTYYVTLTNDLNEKACNQLKLGVMLDGEVKPTKPATVDIVYSNEIRLCISEGKYHQVKRMLAAVGNKVCELHRECIGAIKLDPDLEQGQYRELTKPEIDSIFLLQSQTVKQDK